MLPNGVCNCDVDIKLIVSPTTKSEEIASCLPIETVFFLNNSIEPSIIPFFIKLILSISSFSYLFGSNSHFSF